MSTHETNPLRLPELLAASVRAAAEEMDADRDLPAQLVRELRDSGAFRLLTPEEVGGFEAPLERVLKVYEGFARLDASVAWTVWNANWGFLAALLGEDGAARIWGDGPEPVFANAGQPGMAMVTEEGYRLSGTWQLVSGIDRADWLVVVGVVVADGGPRLTEAGTPDVRLFALSRDQLTVQDTWNVNGMRGTGSNTVVVDSALVPDELVARFDVPARLQRPLYQGFVPALVLPGCSAVVLGVARSAIEEVVSLATTKSTITGGTPAESGRTQALVARSEAALKAARMLLLSAAADMDASGAKGAPATLEQRAALHAAMCHAAEVSREVLVTMYELGGSSSIYRDNPVERLFRDGMVALQHANHSAAFLEAVGRVRFGFDPGVPLF
ncbi:acyl-CoA dehydrogenase domain-containing protein [Streptomyces davaonensis JCM 4913]|uniref:Acyl-CoA dehydrogenase domain-containing protein n=1 Tax=Streptomyces davaonensis (strain DSM 101723 / JCM 4913 / KCC S-0913 / 768) TaxID=1214101 RepID=K4QSG1_STRDJ|nr:acyl-CoA dehydrogenase family protein [Streptomyces davaonensis]CCK24591.1 acyl-CoA dehydrogenase domain-containing protein [Streptomyces davaonensis JCM 4913]